MIAVIIQARMGSTRLPGKVLIPLADGKSVLEHMTNRILAGKSKVKVIIATTENKEDDAIVEEAIKLGIPFFRGDENDVLSRYYWTAKKYNVDIIVRLTSDCPLYDVALLDAMVSEFLKPENKGLDYLSNTLERTFPRGFDTEIFTFPTLETAYFDAKFSYEKEHVTPYIYEHQNLFKVKSYVNPVDYSEYRLTLDTEDDLQLIKIIFNELYKGDYFGTEKIFKLFEKRPELKAINAHVEQKKYRSNENHDHDHDIL